MPISWLENERPQFPAGVTEANNNRTVRKTLVPYDYWDITNIKKALLGTCTLDVSGDLLRTLPWRDPDDPLQYCMRVDHRGLAMGEADDAVNTDTPMTTKNTFKYWELTCYFETLPYGLGGIDDFDPDFPDIIYGVTPDTIGDASNAGETFRYCTKNVIPGRFYITTKTGDFYWVKGSGASGERVEIPFPIPTIIAYQTLECTWYCVPEAAYPATAIANCQGKVNNNDMALPTVPVPAPITASQRYPVQTLLLDSVRSQPCFFPDSTRGFHITYVFQYRPEGWNVFPGPDGVQRPVFRSGGSGVAQLYDAAGFQWLFRSETTVPTPGFPVNLPNI